MTNSLNQDLLKLAKSFKTHINKEKRGEFESLLAVALKKQSIQNGSEKTEKLLELKNLPSSQILSKEESNIFEKIVSNFHYNNNKLNFTNIVLVMKATRLCNLRCTYCHSWRSGPNNVMSFKILLLSILSSLSIDALEKIEFVWHGGETTLLSIDYFKKILWLQQKFRQNNQVIVNTLQTNATRLDNKWINFIKDYDFNIGVSLDGPPEVNDTRRLTKSGKPTSAIVRQGIKKLQEANIKFGILIVIDDSIIKLGAKKLLEYFIELEIKNIAMLNAIPENTDAKNIKGSYLSWNNYIIFMKEMFSLWYKNYKEKIKIKEFEALIGNIKYKTNNINNICIFAGNCMGKYLTIEPNGDVSACDKYIDDKDFYFGNLIENNSLSDLLINSNNLQKAITTQKSDIDRNMKKCKWFDVCNGGCPHDRRLNRYYNKDYDVNCCGVSELLDHIKQHLTV